MVEERTSGARHDDAAGKKSTTTLSLPPPSLTDSLSIHPAHIPHADDANGDILHGRQSQAEAAGRSENEKLIR